MFSKEQINFFASPRPLQHLIDTQKSEDTTTTTTMGTPIVEHSNFASDSNNVEEINPKKTANFGVSL